MEDEAILWCSVLCLERSEECLLGAEDLDGGRGRFCEVDERSGVCDQSRADQFADEDGEVGCDRLHPVLQVLVQLGAVLGQLQYLKKQ